MALIAFLFQIGLPLLFFRKYKDDMRIINHRMKPCIDWARVQGYDIPRRPHLISLFLIDGGWFWWYLIPYGIIFYFSPIGKEVRFYKQSMKVILNKWNEAGQPNSIVDL